MLAAAVRKWRPGNAMVPITVGEVVDAVAGGVWPEPNLPG